MTIYPYLLGSTWVFDDEATGLKEEAFVRGASEMISRLIEAKQIKNAATGFSLTFTDEPFDGHDAELTWLRAEDDGNSYSGTVGGQQMECWLCPALFCYFAARPEKIYVKADPLPLGVDAVWHVDPDDPRQRRFMEPGD